ncbi:hypothetical protein [Microvirga roseola]|nr:hypothetical protein [Microvirga roseola]
MTSAIAVLLTLFPLLLVAAVLAGRLLDRGVPSNDPADRGILKGWRRRIP